MIYGHLGAPESYGHLLSDPVWREAFEWLKALRAQAPDGSHSLRGEHLYAMIMTYDTLLVVNAALRITVTMSICR